MSDRNIASEQQEAGMGWWSFFMRDLQHNGPTFEIWPDGATPVAMETSTRRSIRRAAAHLPQRCAEGAAQAMIVLRRTARTSKQMPFDDAHVLVEKLDRRYEQLGPLILPVRGRAGTAFLSLAEFSPFSGV